MDCDTPENHIENQSNKLEPDNSWSSEPIPTPRTKLLIKVLSRNAKLLTWGSEDAAGYGISFAAPSTRLYARIALR